MGIGNIAMIGLSVFGAVLIVLIVVLCKKNKEKDENYAKREGRHMDQIDLEDSELFDECAQEGHLPVWEGRGGVDGIGIRVSVCQRCKKELRTEIKDLTK